MVQFLALISNTMALLNTSIFTPSTLSVYSVNTALPSTLLTLPSVSTQQGSLLIIKDRAGNAFINKIVLSTTGIDSISTTNLSTNYGTWFLLNDGIKSWFILDSYTNTLSTGVKTVLTPFAPLSVNVSIVGTTLSATWTASPNAISYNVSFYSNTTSANTGGTLIQTLTTTNLYSTLFNVTITQGAQILYFYASVTAVNANGTNTTSSSPAIQPILLPSTPSGLSLSLSSSVLLMTWSSGTYATNYTIVFYQGNTVFETVKTQLLTASTKNTLVAGTSYYATVQSVNAYGVSDTAISNSVTSSVVPLPTASVIIYLNGYNLLCIWVLANNATSYIVQFYQNTTPTTSGGTLFETVTTTDIQKSSSTTLVNGNYYYATVTSVNSYGSSTAVTSSGTSVIITNPPSSPAAIRVNVLDTNIYVSWDAGINATSYQVFFYRTSTPQLSGGTLIETSPITSSLSQVSTVILLSTYYYYVILQSINQYGVISSIAPSLNELTLYITTKQGQISNLSISVSNINGIASISWTSINNVTLYSYVLYFSPVNNYTNSSVIVSGNTATNTLTITTYKAGFYYFTVFASFQGGATTFTSTSSLAQSTYTSPAIVISGSLSIVNDVITVGSAVGALSYRYKLYSNTSNTTVGATLITTVSSVNTYYQLSSLVTVTSNTYYYAVLVASNASGLVLPEFQTLINFMPPGYTANTGITAISINSWEIQGTIAGGNIATIYYSVSGPNNLWNAGWISTTVPGTGSSFYICGQGLSANNIQMFGFITSLPIPSGGDQYQNMVRSWFTVGTSSYSIYENGTNFSVANAAVITSNSIFKVVYDATSSNTYYYSDNYLQRTVNGVVTSLPGGVQRAPGSACSNIIFGYTNNPSAIGSNTCPF